MILLGSGAAFVVAAPLASQQSSDAALEAACRATEVSESDSCPCTITKARAVGITDQQLASLFKDDGHSNPVDQAIYGRFWQVKAQCIADATMARMGISANNPLPGVPAHMRPGMPLPGSGVATGPSRPHPLPDNRPVGRVNSNPAPAPTAPIEPAPSRSVERTVIPGFEGGPATVEFKRQTPFFDYYFAYSQSIEAEPALLAMAEASGRAKFAEVAPNYTSNNRSYRSEYYYGWYETGRLGQLLSIGQSERSGSRGAAGFSGALLWHTELDREIAWTDVFDARVWNGQVRRDYCAALQAEKRERGTDYNQNCPDYDTLQISLSEGESGNAELKFTALNGVAGSYAEGPYDITLPVTGAIKQAAKPAYAELLGASATSQSPALALVAGLGPVAASMWGGAGCSTELFLLPASGTMPRSVTRLFDFTRSSQTKRIASVVDMGADQYGYLINLGGRDITLRPVQPNGTVQEYSDGTTTLILRHSGATITDNPAYGFTPIDGEISSGGDSETFKAVEFSAC